ncbi:MAG: two-component regulator propeller domain-containing protein [Candidatus Zixiibacteriota bacterium]
MESLKTRIISICLSGLLLIFLFQIASAGVGDWTTYTNMNSVNQILLQGGKLWCATTGGAAILDINDSAFTRLTNVEGLGGNYLYSVARDTSGSYWWGAQNGTLTKYTPENDSWKVYSFIDRDESRLHINRIVPWGDQLWIATNKALVLFLINKNGGEIKETYRRLGEHLNGEEEVTCVRMVGDRIWAGLIGGVATANRNDPNLLDFSRWISFTQETSVGLGSNSIFCLTNIGDQILVGTDRGVFEFHPLDSSWQSLGLNDRRINDLEYLNQKLYAATDYGLFVYQDQNWIPFSNSGLLSVNLHSATIDSKGAIWVGTADQGISAYKNTVWENYPIEGPPSNYFVDMETDQDGNLWCAQDVFGASQFDGDKWTSLSHIPEISGHLIRAVKEDLEGNIWFSSWGGGVIKYDRDTTWVRYTEKNSPLRGIVDDPTYVVVNDLVIDERGNRWFPLWDALDTTRLVCIPDQPETTWVVFYDRDGINLPYRERVSAQGGHLYLCLRGSGLLDYNYNWTVKDKTDDQVIHYSRESDHLSDNTVWCARVDKDGVLWVGTSSGLDKFDPDFERFSPVKMPNPLGPQVNDIAVDERNNKWIATVNGLGKINSTGVFEEFLTTFNSKICNNNIQRLYIDKNTGNIWIGTDEGLSRFESGIGAPAKDLSEVLPFPNPFILERGSEILTFDRLPYESVVRIFSVSGELIKRIKSGNQWDGRNQAGELVASGIYLFHIQDSSGKSTLGKIAVIRK